MMGVCGGCKTSSNSGPEYWRSGLAKILYVEDLSPCSRWIWASQNVSSSTFLFKLRTYLPPPPPPTTTHTHTHLWLSETIYATNHDHFHLASSPPPGPDPTANLKRNFSSPLPPCARFSGNEVFQICRGWIEEFQIQLWFTLSLQWENV